jgi:hypothetical protein
MLRASLLVATSALVVVGCAPSNGTTSSGFQLVTPVSAQAPTFLQVGSTYLIANGMSSLTATVTEIDQKSGRIRATSQTC